PSNHNESRKNYSLRSERFSHAAGLGISPSSKSSNFRVLQCHQKTLLRGIIVAMYIVGQERRLVDPPSQVVAGVRTVTTKMDGRCAPHVAAPILFMAQAVSLCFLFLGPCSFDSSSRFA